MIQPVAAEDIPWTPLPEHGGIWVRSTKKHLWWCVEFRPIAHAASARDVYRDYVFGYFQFEEEARQFIDEVTEAKGTYAKPLAVLTYEESWGVE